MQLYPDGSSAVVYLGNRLLTGVSPQCVVPGNVWQGSRVVEGGRYALIGTTVSPGFDFVDFERGDREVLSNQYPRRVQLIESLT
jgi:predicted cupin superfamily sugar epimerase